MPEPDLSVIIASYNTRDLLRDCIESIIDSTKEISYEIIVVDDCSPDDSREMVAREFPQVRLVKNEFNQRYVKTNNRGLREAKGRYGLLLNSDTVVQSGAFDILVKYMDEHPDVAAGGPKLINPDGSIQHCIRNFVGLKEMLFQALNLHLIWPSNPLTEKYYNTKFAYDKPTQVPSIGTTAYIIRRSTWETYGMLDERFTLAFSDLAYNHMLGQNGQKIHMIPEAVVLHYGSQSINQNGIKEIRLQHEALRVFYENYIGKKDGPIKRAFVRASIKARYWMKVLEFKMSRSKRVLKGPGAPSAAR